MLRNFLRRKIPPPYQAIATKVDATVQDVATDVRSANCALEGQIEEMASKSTSGQETLAAEIHGTGGIEFETDCRTVRQGLCFVWRLRLRGL